MQKELEEFISLNKLFHQNGFIFYLVGGTVRDFILNKPLEDMDAVTDATPDQVKEFLPDADFTFSKMGSMRVKSNGVRFDVTTLRKEKTYLDSRHPLDVTFVKTLEEDYIRRDFTINAMYMDEHFIVYDYANGRADLNKGIIRMVGSPEKRIKEDPLRIIRAIRFAADFNFKIDEDLAKAIKKNVRLLDNLNPEKIKMDLKKIKALDIDYRTDLFDIFDINYLLDMID